MTCKELIDFLNDYVDMDLPEDQRRAFDAHLARCPSCRTYLDQYRAVSEMAWRSMQDEPSPLPQELVEVILRAREAASGR